MRIGFDGTPLQYTHSGVGTYVEQLLRHLTPACPQWNYCFTATSRLPVTSRADSEKTLQMVRDCRSDREK